MTFKQPGAFTFAKVDVPGNVFENNRISVILFNVGKDTAQPVIIRAHSVAHRTQAFSDQGQ